MQEYTPFPPPQQPRKVDLEMESGEYFLTATQKASRAEHEKQERQREAQDAKKRKREEPYLPPKVLPLLAHLHRCCYCLCCSPRIVTAE